MIALYQQLILLSVLFHCVDMIYSGRMEEINYHNICHDNTCIVAPLVLVLATQNQVNHSDKIVIHGIVEVSTVGDYIELDRNIEVVLEFSIGSSLQKITLYRAFSIPF